MRTDYLRKLIFGNWTTTFGNKTSQAYSETNIFRAFLRKLVVGKLCSGHVPVNQKTWPSLSCLPHYVCVSETKSSDSEVYEVILELCLHFAHVFTCFFGSCFLPRHSSFSTLQAARSFSVNDLKGAEAVPHHCASYLRHEPPCACKPSLHRLRAQAKTFSLQFRTVKTWPIWDQTAVDGLKTQWKSWRMMKGTGKTGMFRKWQQAATTCFCHVGMDEV